MCLGFLYARLVGTYYGMAWASVCLSVRPSVHKACRHDTDWTIWARTVKLGTLTTYDKRMNPTDFRSQGHMLHINVKPCNHDTDWTVSARTIKLGTHTSYDKRTTSIDFQGQGSKVKVTRYILMLNLVNTIQTEPLKLQCRTVKIGKHTTYDKRTTLIDFQGQGSKVKVTRYALFNFVNMIQTEPFQLGPSNLVHILLMIRGRHLLIFKVRGQRSRSHVTY